MTPERLAERTREPEIDTDRKPGVLAASSILAMCDRLLDEVGRRRHMFAWLRVPGAGAGEWLAVDAYYPRARLVVMCRPAGDAHDALYRELIPTHGLGLLMLDPAVLGDDPAAVEAAVAAKLFDLEHVPRGQAAAAERRPPQRAEPRRGAGSGRSAEPQTSAEPRHRAKARSEPLAPEWTPVKVERMAVAPVLEQGVGLVLGLALACVLIAEMYLDVVYVFGPGRIVLAFAIALEACSRALGAVAAVRAGERAWAFACALGGSPVVAWFALLRRSDGAEVEPAPLAGMLAGLAAVLAVLALLIGT
jgi:hypothetical protein